MAQSKLTKNLKTPRSREEFAKDKEWARKIVVEYTKKTDPEWCLAGCLKVLDVVAKENPAPGMLSDSYVLEIMYSCGGDSDCTVESWFVKVPNCTKAYLLDEMEVFMYSNLLPLLQAFGSNACNVPSQIQLPIPLVYHCAFDENKPEINVLVMENLRDQGYKPLRPETCGLVFMRAAMTSLATIHASAFAYQNALGGRTSFLSRFPLIKEDNMPRAKLMKSTVDDLLEPYLEYMGLVAPEIGPQMAFLKKFSRFLLPIFHDLQRDKDLWNLKIMVHGDSKIDNFMFKKNVWSVEEEYLALIIDWQGVCYDLLSGDLLWTLYGFYKNLPDKNSTVDTFIDYSLNFYHQELLRLLQLMHVDIENLNLPLHEYDATVLIRKGFLYDFLKIVFFKPLLTMKGKDVIKNWYQNKDTVPLPDEAEVFKTGTKFVNYIHLQITIATEVGVFHDLAPLCIQGMKDAMFGQFKTLDDTEDELEAEQEKLEAEKEKAIKEAAEILKAANPEEPSEPPEPSEPLEPQEPSENPEQENDKGEEPAVEIVEEITSPEPEPEAEVPEEPIIPVRPEMVSKATDTTDLETESTSTSINTEIETTSTSCDIDTEAKVMKEESTQTEEQEPEKPPAPKLPAKMRHECLWTTLGRSETPEVMPVSETKKRKKKKKKKKQEVLQLDIQTKITGFE